jgi:uncharacterized Zn-binding protein involved in type VI secretion
MAGLLAGAAIGLAIGAAILFTVVTGGAGAVLIGAAVAGGVALGAGGALAGMEIGKMFSGPPCGGVLTGSSNTFIESLMAARAGRDMISHGPGLVAQGSSTVFVNGAPLARRTDKCSCGGPLIKTCSHTYIGGDTLTLVPIADEVPSWLVTTLKWTAWIGGGVALVLTGIGAGVVVAGLGLVGSVAGGMLGGVVGKAIGGIWGERAGRVGEIVGEFGGALLGGIGAAKLGEAFGITPKAPVEDLARTNVEEIARPAVDPTKSPIDNLVDAARPRAPDLAAKVEDLQSRGWQVRFAENGDGPGSYCSKDSKTIVLDPALQSNPARAAEVLAHEAGHANYTQEPYQKFDMSMSRDEYVQRNLNNDLLDEGEATLSSLDARQEILDSGGRDIGTSGQNAAEYQRIYGDYKNGNITRDQARQQIADIFGNETTSTTGQSYNDYYGARFQEHYDNVIVPWAQQNGITLK